MLGCKDEQEDFPGEVIVYPNPFSYDINIILDLNQDSDVIIQLLDAEMKAQSSFHGLISAKENPIVDGNFSSGSHEFRIDMTGKLSGVYILDVSANGVGERIKLSKR